MKKFDQEKRDHKIGEIIFGLKNLKRLWTSFHFTTSLMDQKYCYGLGLVIVCNTRVIEQ